MEETPRPRPVQRDASAPIPLPVDDGETRPMRASAPATGSVAAQRVSTPLAERSADAPTTVIDERDERAEAVDRIRNGPVSVETVQVQRPKLGKRERRGAAIAGALGLPLVTLGLITLAVPIGAWYLTTVFKTIIVAFTSLFSEATARDLDQQITAVDPTTFGNVSFWLSIIGAVMLLGGLLLSWLVLRAHQVFHPVLVTLTAVPMGLGLSFVLQAAAGALGGLFFQFGDGGVSAVVANAIFGVLLFLVLSVAIAVATGILVWWWMASVFRATVVTGAPEAAAR
ncbi:hypothetical protein [Agrococcus beijingensis]|uniref:hypothetical protein n=1 Tax=Agrococcus beijingensis TaxID=3068634 RepID=UPI0027423D49|nr:hypothetical protein [Agrococcus sp. REN33]